MDREDSGYTYFDVLEARRAAKTLAHSLGVTDEHEIDALASKAGRRVAVDGSINRGQIVELIGAVQ
jgi:hypothetical protein